MKRLKKIHDDKNFNPIFLCSFITAIIVIFLTIGFSAFHASLDMSGRVVVRIEKDIRVTHISSPTNSNSAYTNWEDYNVSRISSSMVLPNANSTVTYDVEITNLGNIDMVNIKMLKILLMMI